MGFFFGGKVLLLAALLQAYFEGSTAQCTVKLTNKVVREGDLNTQELCYTPDFIQWQVLASSTPLSNFQNITNYDNVITPGLSGAYAVDNTGLTILNATTTPLGGTPISTSGLYIAKYIIGSTNYTAGAKLLVIRQGPICSCSPTSNQLTGSVVYAAYIGIAPMRPIFTWTLNGEVINTSVQLGSSNDAYTFKASYTITVNPNDTGSYQCQLTFSAPAVTASTLRYNVSTNAPDFNESCDAQLCPITTTAKIRTNTWSQTTTSILPTSTASSEYPTKETRAETIEITTKTTTTSPTPSCKLSQIFIYTVITDVNPTAANGYCDWVDPVDCPYDIRTCKDCRDNYDLCSNSTLLCEEMCRVKTGNNNTRGHCVDNFNESGCPCLFKGFKACFCS